MKNLTFEQANAQLEELVKKLESGELGLQESLQCYEQAATLLNFCYKQLDGFKVQITDINERIAKRRDKEETEND